MVVRHLLRVGGSSLASDAGGTGPHRACSRCRCCAHRLPGSLRSRCGTNNRSDGRGASNRAAPSSRSSVGARGHSRSGGGRRICRLIANRYRRLLLRVPGVLQQLLALTEPCLSRRSEMICLLLRCTDYRRYCPGRLCCPFKDGCNSSVGTSWDDKPRLA